MRAHLLTATWLLAACGPAASSSPVERTDSAGVDIARVRALPSLLDTAWLWSHEVTATIHTQAAGEPVVYEAAGVLPLDDDRVLVVDRYGDDALVLLDVASGRAERRFGRRGRGPGEVAGPLDPWVDGEGSLWVADQGNRKILRFGADGAVEEEVPLRLDWFQALWVAQPGRGLLVEEWLRSTGEEERHVARVDLGSGTTRPLATLPAPREWSPQRGARIQAGRPLWAALPAGVVTTRSDLPDYRFHDNDGRLVREIRLPLTRRRLTDAEHALRVKEHGASAAGAFEPGRMAITNALFPVDDSVFATFQTALWRAAEDPAPPDGRVVWRLIHVDGTPRGSFMLPDGLSPRWSGGGVIWGVRPDAAGAPVLERLRLLPPTRPPTPRPAVSVPR